MYLLTMCWDGAHAKRSFPMLHLGRWKYVGRKGTQRWSRSLPGRQRIWTLYLWICQQLLKDPAQRTAKQPVTQHVTGCVNGSNSNAREIEVVLSLRTSLESRPAVILAALKGPAACTRSKVGVTLGHNCRKL